MAPLGSHQTSKNAVESKGQQVQFVLNDEPTEALRHREQCHALIVQSRNVDSLMFTTSCRELPKAKSRRFQQPPPFDGGLALCALTRALEHRSPKN
jgi:hypothetical protein